MTGTILNGSGIQPGICGNRRARATYLPSNWLPCCMIFPMPNSMAGMMRWEAAWPVISSWNREWSRRANLWMPSSGSARKAGQSRTRCFVWGWQAPWAGAPARNKRSGESRRVDREFSNLLRRLVVRIAARGVVGHVHDLLDFRYVLEQDLLHSLLECDVDHPATLAATTEA